MAVVKNHTVKKVPAALVQVQKHFIIENAVLVRAQHPQYIGQIIVKLRLAALHPDGLQHELRAEYGLAGCDQLLKGAVRPGRR